MSDVFISYAHSTAVQAQAAAAALRALDYSVWLDDDLPAHRAYGEVIAEQIRAAKAVVVIWSADATKSEWVRSEAERARGAKKLVQLNVDGAQLPMPFDQIYCADMTGWGGDVDSAGWRKVVASIDELVGSAARARTAGFMAPETRPSGPLLAVLAFDNVSGDPEMKYFSDGISEEIQLTVARGADLQVIAKSSSFQFRGADKAVRKVASELKATHLLDGSVRRSGNRVRISAQLVECATAITLWSERFDRDLTDIFALQDEIAAAVAAALTIKFAPAVERLQIDPQIYDLYLKASSLPWSGPDVEKVTSTLNESLRMLERVVSAAPTFADAWADLGWRRSYGLRIFGGARFPGLTRGAAAVALDAAVGLNPAIGSAYVGLAQLQPWGAHVLRESLFRKALAVEPHETIFRYTLAWFCLDTGQMREALHLAEQARELDPVDQLTKRQYASMLDIVGRAAEAVPLWDELCRSWPDAEDIVTAAMGARVWDGDWNRFEALVQVATDRGVNSRNFQRAVKFLRNLRDPDPAYTQGLLSSMREGLQRDGSLRPIQLVGLAHLGRVDEVFQLVDRASFAASFEEDGQAPEFVFQLFVERANHRMIRDIRFVALCGKLGLCDYWLKTERWPDCADQVPYDFKAEARRWLAKRV